jgi:hypothetical protein
MSNRNWLEATVDEGALLGGSGGVPLRDHVLKIWGGKPDAPLEEQMLKAATSEALSLAWLSGVPQRTFPGLLEAKIREAKTYLRRQERIRGIGDQIIATAF